MRFASRPRPFATQSAASVRQSGEHRGQYQRRPCAGFAASLSGKDSGKPWQTRRNRSGLSAISDNRGDRSTVARSPCNRGNRSTLARLNRAENGLASRPPRRPCPRPSEMRRAFCKPSAPRLQHNQRKPSGDVATVQPFRPVSGSTVRPWRTSNAATYPATVRQLLPSNAPPVPASVRQSGEHRGQYQRQAVAVRRAAGSVRRSTVCRLSAIRQAATVGKDSPPPIRHHRTPQGFLPMSAATVRPWRNRSTVRGLSVYPASRGGSTVRRLSAATVRRHNRRKRAATARPCVSPRRTGSRPSRRAAPLQGRFTRFASVRKMSGKDSGNIERGERAAPCNRETNCAYYGHTFPRRLFQTWRGSTLPPDSSPPSNATSVRQGFRRPCAASRVPLLARHGGRTCRASPATVPR